MLAQILAEGYATVRLDADAAARLATLYSEATQFFARDTEAKLQYSVPSRSTGYRPHAYAHAGLPDKPDLNESFLYWPQKSKTPPNDHEITAFLDAYEAYRVVAARIAGELIDELRARYGHVPEVSFEDASVLQINSFGEPSDEELLQQPHEDAILLTVIWASAPGLEAVLGDELRPLNFTPDEVVVMPASVMTVMTGGEIQPLVHLARNHKNVDRKSMMYFVSPNADAEIEPFVVNDFNRTTNIRELVLNNPEAYFGLAKDFV
jgi:isopenicillin N synthase-like dioxygenase